MRACSILQYLSIGTHSKKYYYSIITYNLTGDGLNQYYDYINVQSYTAPNDAYNPVTNFIGNGSIGVNPAKVLAGADTQNKRYDYIQANKDYQRYDLDGIFAWMFDSINGKWNPDYSSVLTPIYNITYPWLWESNKYRLEYELFPIGFDVKQITVIIIKLALTIL